MNSQQQQGGSVIQFFIQNVVGFQAITTLKYVVVSLVQWPPRKYHLLWMWQIGSSWDRKIVLLFGNIHWANFSINLPLVTIQIMHQNRETIDLHCFYNFYLKRWRYLNNNSSNFNSNNINNINNNSNNINNINNNSSSSNNNNNNINNNNSSSNNNNINNNNNNDNNNNNNNNFNNINNIYSNAK